MEKEQKEPIYAFYIKLLYTNDCLLWWFQRGEVKFLICTDVAARGIDVSGLPYGK